MTSTAHTILLVEEDSERREETIDALLARGLRVVATEDAAGALDVLSRGPERVTLVVTDLDIEPIGGFNLARAIHRRWSSVPVAVVSGDTTRTTAIRALSAGVVLLPRAATPTNLAQAIAKLLAPGSLAFSLAVLSETGSSFVPFASGA
jgi:DNA-binding NtrC family response regulator